MADKQVILLSSIIILGILGLIVGILLSHRRKKRNRTSDTDEILMSTNQIAIISMLVISIILVAIVAAGKLTGFHLDEDKKIEESDKIEVVEGEVVGYEDSVDEDEMVEEESVESHLE